MLRGWVEAWGLLQALNWLAELGYQNFIIESDCKRLVDALSGCLNGSSEF